MKTLHRGMGFVVVAMSVLPMAAVEANTVRSDSGSPASSAPPENLQSGTVTSVSVERGVLVVAGHTFRLNPVQVAYSDDRKTPVKGGLSKLAAGDKVVLKSVTRDGVQHVVQLIVKD